MSEKIDQSLIRKLVREVISEVVSGEEKAGPGQPKSSRAARKPVVEEVTISSDADLSRFIKHLLALSKYCAPSVLRYISPKTTVPCWVRRGWQPT